LKFEQPPVVAVVQLQHHRPIEMGEGEGKRLDLSRILSASART